MDKADKLDWSLIQTFLAVAESGSLSEAARQLGITQPTAGRQVRQIEETLNLSLFNRRPRGLALTEAGAALVPHARAMADNMNALGLVAAGRADHLSGPVRITASVATAHHHLPPIIARLRAEEPDIQIELVPSDESENLLYREADIAVRMYRSEQLDIVTAHLGELELGIFAAKAYLDRKGRPRNFGEMFQRDLVGYDRSDRLLRGMRDFGIEAQRDWFGTRCDHHAVYFELIRAGCGIGFAQTSLGESDPSLERLFPEVPIPSLPVWLAAHEAVRATPRVRRVWDALADGMRAHLS
ncbi:LysR family transcriptional regulator [Thalassococcus lentus]|uniref:LysR family transcriptional regulator n=1 Tax=Thalassococcus lentus TaxID=1210524 RepID=A0ABT4XNL9_9RHOB|nr:LysR family transcriptional regulator [Thalassococcus lentus]MDA7423549.1 LysR family transcriptional regulator [Thalassococcus lentus]